MPTVKVVLRNLSPITGLATIAFRVTEDRKSVFQSTGFRVKPNQFKDGIVIKHPDAVLINSTIENKRGKLFQSIFDDKPVLTYKQAINKQLEYYEANQMPGSFNRMLVNRKMISEAWEKDYPINKITKELVQAYVTYRLQRGNNPNTIKKNLRDMGNVLRFVEYDGVNHFALASTKIKALPVSKEKLSTAEIKKLEKIKLDGMLEVARDMFLFSYYTHGMRFENVATFELKMITGKSIKYRMNKGKKVREIALHEKLQAIINKYKKAGTLYLFPAVNKEHTTWNKKDVIGSANTVINAYLKRVSIIAGIDKKFSFHSGRYSFANNADQSGVDRNVLMQALGHSSVKITEIYLNSLSDDKVNDAVKGLYK